MNSHQATKTAAIGPRQHLLIVTLMFGTLLSATSVLGQQMRFFPIRTAPLGSPPGTFGEPVSPKFNSDLACWELQVEPGVEVDLGLQGIGWGNAPGSPTLGAIQGTLEFTSLSNGFGGDLNPKGLPESPGDGHYTPHAYCLPLFGGDGRPCVSPFDILCTDNGVCGGNPDWIMFGCSYFFFVPDPGPPPYVWAVSNPLGCFVDDGEFKTFGGLILDVPLDAAGTYEIALVPGPNDTFMVSGVGTPIPDLVLIPACITILGTNEPGKCCSDIGPNVVCEDDVTAQDCAMRPEPNSFTAGETCDGECACPTCLSDADCNDGDPCTADFCVGCGQCVHTPSCPDMRFYPIRLAPLGSPPGTVGNRVTPEFNSELGCWELQVLAGDGVEVDIDLQAFGWGGAAGSRTLLVIQATVISAGYDNGVGAPLNPKGWPDSADGVYQAVVSCEEGGDGRPCCRPFDETCASGENGNCMRNPNWVMPPCANDFPVNSAATLDYAWATAASNDCNIDDGAVHTMGGLILEVPQDARGTYFIDINPDPQFTFMLSGQETTIPGLTLTPACITVTTPTKNRYLTFVPSEAGPVAYKLDMVSSLFHPTATVSGWIGVPDANGIASLEPDPVTREWTEPVVHITGCEIAPVAEFELQASADDGATFVSSEPLQTTPQPGGGKFWGDIVGPFDGISWPPPNRVTNIDDAVAVIVHFRHTAGAPELARTDVVPQEPNRVVNINDVLFVIFAFQGEPYPFGCLDDPCQDNLANPCP